MAWVSWAARSVSQWQAWRHHLEYVDYAGAVVLVAAIIYLIVRWNRARRDPDGRNAEPAADVVAD